MDLFTRTLMMASGGGVAAGSAYWIASSSTLSLRSIDVDTENNVYAVGENGTGYYIVKLNSTGSVVWHKHLSAETNDIAFGVSVASSDISVYVAGRLDGVSTGFDALLIKFDKNGVEQWTRSLATSGFSSQINSVYWDSDSAIYVAGYTDNTANASQAMLLAKYTSTGTLSWVRTLDNGATFEEARAVSSAAAGNVTMAGYSDNINSVASFAQYNTTGTIQWQRRLTGVTSETFSGICVDASSNVFLVGTTASQGAGGNDFLIAKYNSTGTIQWQRSLGGTGSEIGASIAFDSGGNIYVVGTTASQGAGGNDILIAKYNTSGTIQWQRTLGTTGSDAGRAVAIGPSDTLYVLGNTTITKIPSDGTLTGTYGSYVYQASTLTDATRTLTAATTAYTDAAGLNTSASRAISVATSTDTFSLQSL